VSSTEQLLPLVRKLVRTSLGALCLGFIVAGSAVAVEPPKDPLQQLMDGAKPTIDLRTRYEHADRDGLRSSKAYTARLRLGIMTGELDSIPYVSKFRIFVEFEDTETTDTNDYNAAGVHGPANKTVIADPESRELNRLNAQWTSFGTDFNAGRQRILHENQRFIGNVGWRQNEQTYDAATLTRTLVDDLDLTYSYLWRVNRIFGNDVSSSSANADFDDTQAHLIQLTYSGIEVAKIRAYGYLLDLENDATANNSNNTFGMSVTGKLPVNDDVKLGYRAEYAHQWDAGSSMLDYRAGYVHGKTWGEYDGHALGVGYELLESDSINNIGTHASFRTPLATGHKWNGFADVFLTTPTLGLEDVYAWLNLSLPAKFKFKAVFHNFKTDHGRDDLGQEWDFVLSRKLPWKITALAKYADFDTKRRAGTDSQFDIERFWFQLEYKY